MMSNQNKLTASENDIIYTYAGFWIRSLATLTDILISFIIISPIGYLLYGNDYFVSDALYLGIGDFVISAVLPIIATIYLWIKFSATPGKILFRLKILDAQTGNPITLKQAIFRYLGYTPSILIFFVGIIWIAFDKKKQGWHDKIAKTVVVTEL